MRRLVFDYETYCNLFVACFKVLGTNEWYRFKISELENDILPFLSFLKEVKTNQDQLIGYNCLEFDGQVTEFILEKGKKVTALEIHEFVNALINRPIEDRFKLPYSEWDLSHRYIDIYKVNHYDNKKTSLKWLQISTRWHKAEDIPVSPLLPIPKSSITKIVKYCDNDVESTEYFFLKCQDMVKLREDLVDKYGEWRILNMSDSSMGAYIFENILVKKYGFNKKDLAKGTYHDSIAVKDCLVNYIDFNDPELVRVYESFKNTIYTDVKTKGIKGEEYAQQAFFQDMIIVYGSGGLHACYKAGEYLSDDENIIVDIDVASFYPNLAIVNNFYPKHIGKSFCTIYKDVFKERQTFAKGSSSNYAYKIALNSVYGKSNSAYSIFFDPAYTLKTTINGQLLLTMLAEALSELGRLLMINTDGLTIRIPKTKLDELNEICQSWENMTGLTLEHNQYTKMIMRDVNNYIAVDIKGKAKRKGIFEIYYDYTEEDGKPHQYHKSPDATVISQALFNYYANDVNIDDTIDNCNDIYEFCYGIKKQKGFEHWLITADQKGVIDIEKRDDKVIRYYISSKGANIFKHWKDNRKNDIIGVNRGQLVKLAMNIRNPEVVTTKKATKTKPAEVRINYEIDKQHYKNECYELIDLIKSGSRDTAYLTRDTAYLKYVKKNKDGNMVGEIKEPSENIYDIDHN